MKSIFRSILAVLAGLVTLTIVSFAIEAAVNPVLLHLFPSQFPDHDALARSIPARLIMTAYTLLAIAAGGYVTAWVASRAKLRDAVIMGAVEAALTLYVMIAMPFPEARQSPRWGFIVAIVLMIPAAALGALAQMRRRPPIVA
jgi:hypothetical protein